ncbi:MAG: sel1 repeat family protein [Bacteroidales bacterium]|nr:sel1 repeat family protein [Bacteroidales bacterium]
MGDLNKTETLKDIVNRESAASEEVKQNEIAAYRQIIENNRREIEALTAANKKKKAAVIWLSIILGLVLVGICVYTVLYNPFGLLDLNSENNIASQTLTETTSEEDTLQQAADKNDDKAQLALGQRYFSGTDGYKTDKVQAAEWFARSANNGNVTAMLLLAKMYETGEGIEKNNQSAFKYYFMAAREDDKEALYKTGKCYYYGNAVEKNTEKALFYLNKSASQNYTPAVTLINLIKEDIKNAQRSAAADKQTETPTTKHDNTGE